MTRVLQSHTWRFLGARCASSCHVACTVVGLDLDDHGWTGDSDHSGKTILTLNALIYCRWSMRWRRVTATRELQHYTSLRKFFVLGALVPAMLHGGFGTRR